MTAKIVKCDNYGTGSEVCQKRIDTAYEYTKELADQAISRPFGGSATPERPPML